VSGASQPPVLLWHRARARRQLLSWGPLLSHCNVFQCKQSALAAQMGIAPNEACMQSNSTLPEPRRRPPGGCCCGGGCGSATPAPLAPCAAPTRGAGGGGGSLFVALLLAGARGSPKLGCLHSGEREAALLRGRAGRTGGLAHPPPARLAGMATRRPAGDPKARRPRCCAFLPSWPAVPVAGQQPPLMMGHHWHAQGPPAGAIVPGDWTLCSRPNRRVAAAPWPPSMQLSPSGASAMLDPPSAVQLPPIRLPSGKEDEQGDCRPIHRTSSCTGGTVEVFQPVPRPCACFDVVNFSCDSCIGS
jgi:hypothetical protein